MTEEQKKALIITMAMRDEENINSSSSPNRQTNSNCKSYIVWFYIIFFTVGIIGLIVRSELFFLVLGIFIMPMAIWNSINAVISKIKKVKLGKAKKSNMPNLSIALSPLFHLMIAAFLVFFAVSVKYDDFKISNEFYEAYYNNELKWADEEDLKYYRDIDSKNYMMVLPIFEMAITATILGVNRIYKTKYDFIE